tara:strand:- start:12681 stop:13841 length:1161 start_codon:yes stop_codon:yes gene_type:complete
MAVSYNLGNTNFGLFQMKGGAKSSAPKFLYGRVVDVINDRFHPDYDTYDKALGLYGVIFTPVETAALEGEDAPVQFAYCSNSSLRRLPLKNEFVKLESRPSPIGRDGDAAAQRTYWTEIHSIWNHPHHNAYPDSLQVGEQDGDLGVNFEEQDKVNPLQLFAGDVSLESRYGSSIRLGGTQGEGNKISNSKNNGSPYTIVRNGQHEEVEDGNETILEDINKDKSSIYLTSNHKLDLDQARGKHEGLKSQPESSKRFEGAQIVMNSDRIFFNSKKEGIYLTSEKDIGLSGQQVGIDGDKYVALDAKKIYLGRIALKREDEPVLLGQATIDWLTKLMFNLDTLISALAQSPPDSVYAGAVKTVALAVYPQIPLLRSSLVFLKSRKVFVE